MNVLGISAFFHDAAAALVVDGNLVAFAEEERFVRQKHAGNFPHNAIEYCLHYAGLTVAELDEVAFYLSPHLMFAHYMVSIPKIATTCGLNSLAKYWLSLFKFLDNVTHIKDLLGYEGKVTYVEHHFAHAAYAFYMSPFDSAGVLTVDSIGENVTTAIFKGADFRLEKLYEITDPNSLGYFYGAITEYLGYSKGDGEGTVMALAAFGELGSINLRKTIGIEKDGRFSLNSNYIAPRGCAPSHDRLTPRFYDVYGSRRKRNAPISDIHQNMAAELQDITEEILIKLAKKTLTMAESKNLCLSGGVTLNSVANARIRAEVELDGLFVGPAANDAGAAPGAALYVYTEKTKLRPNLENTVFLGPSYTNEHIKKALDRAHVVYSKSEQPSKHAAELIAQGQVIGWYQGRMETGPRALGNRSILANPSMPNIKDYINGHVKFREQFRPFAPTILHQYQHEWFDCGATKLPYMLETTKFLSGKASTLPAVSHVDNTSRIQSLSKEDSKEYYDLIWHFYLGSGIPLILNTSFNVKGEPIVCTPEDALRCFFSNGLHTLIMGSFIVTKPVP